MFELENQSCLQTSENGAHNEPLNFSTHDKLIAATSRRELIFCYKYIETEYHLATNVTVAILTSGKFLMDCLFS